MHSSFFRLMLAALLWATITPMLSAQLEDLTRDTAFFRQQKLEYQRWLDQTGMGKTLKVQALKVTSDDVSLYLGFHATELDEIVNAWDTLKVAYETQGGMTLEEQLFFRLVSFMGLRQEAASIQIYDTYDLSLDPLFFRGIYYDEGQIRVDVNNPKSQIRDIKINYTDVSGAKKSSKAEFSRQYTRDYVFDRVMAFAVEKYGRPKCEGRNPKVKRLPNEDHLRFQVSDLCKEVLVDEQNPVVCRWLKTLGYNCTWIKRELLTFTVIYIPTESGFQLNITLEGKVGSGYYDDIRRDAYMDMETDFKSYLEDYADQIALEIKDYLRRT